MLLIPFISAGHTGAQSGAQGVAISQSQFFDEGAQTVRLRNAVAERLANTHNINVLIDSDSERLTLLCHRIDSIAAATPDIFCIDIHFNAFASPDANGTEVIVANDAGKFEIDLAVRLLNATARAIGTNRRALLSEKQTPHRRLAMLHLNCPAVILEVCFCTNPADVNKYRSNINALVNALAQTIAQTTNNVKR